MPSARDDFEEWREGTLSNLKRDRETLSARRQDLEASCPASRSAGAVAEEIARDLEAFCQRHGFVEATLEMVRRSAPRGPPVYDEVLHARRSHGQLDSYSDLIQQPFWRFAREYVEKQPGDCELFARLDGTTRRVEVTVVDGSTLQQRNELKDLSHALARLDAEAARINAMKLNYEPFGSELAWRVVRKLGRNSLHYEHRDYCGMALIAVGGGGFVYTSVWDGYFSDQDVVRRFKDQDEVARWLARQSEASLSNYAMDAFYFRNQTLTRERLEEFAGS